MKKHFSTVLLILVLFIGLSLLLYPTVSDYWNSLHQTRAIAEYAEQVADIDDMVYQELWAQAKAYNQELLTKVSRLVLTDEEEEVYDSILDVTGTGIMGYIDIPTIDCSLPIYHGTGEAELQIAIGHIAGTSFPVGGESTHTVLSGHRGLPSARLFSDLDKLAEGDTFMLQVLDETLTYEVDQIRIVEPQEVDELDIIEGEDLCTLVTCTPYGINTHRLLVRGHRVANAEEETTIRVTADALQIEPVIVAPFVAIPMLLILLIILLATTRRKKERH